MSESNTDTAAELQRLAGEVEELRRDFDLKIHALAHLAGIHIDRVNERTAVLKAHLGQ